MLVQGPIRRIAIATAVRICAISKPSILLNHNHTCGMAYCASLQRAYVPVKSSSVQCDYSRMLHTSSSYSAKVVPYLLADIGEGIAEATILEWFVISTSSQSNMFIGLPFLNFVKPSSHKCSLYCGVWLETWPTAATTCHLLNTPSAIINFSGFLLHRLCFP